MMKKRPASNALTASTSAAPVVKKSLALSWAQASWFRLRRGGLIEPFPSAEEAARALFGIQAQILPAAGLSLWNRTRGLSFQELLGLLYEGRSLVKLWGQRHTLHLYPSRDWPLLHGALSGARTWWERQAEARGEDLSVYHARLEKVAALLRQQKILGRSALRAAKLGLEEEMFSGWGGIFSDLVRRGDACHGRPEGGEGRFASRAHWLPDLAWEPPPRAEANVQIARRYLGAYGPATVQDFAYWRGLRVGEAKRAYEALGAELLPARLLDQEVFALCADREALTEPAPAPETWPVRLLYRFDPLLLGHKDKSWLLDEAHRTRVFRPAGHIEGTLLVRGRVLGTWRYDRSPKGLSISVSSFAPLPREVRAAVKAQAAGVARFFGVAFSGPVRGLQSVAQA